jgi:hypothetical protein
VQQELRVDTAGVHAMAARWGASVGDLNETAAPTGLGFSCQTSVASVNGRQSVDDHDGHGVNDEALQDAVRHPLSPPSYQINEQGKGSYLYQGKDATVVLNKDGEVITAWPNNHHGWRH